MESVSEYSFEGVCLPLRDELLGYARKLTGDLPRADDIVQDSLEKALLGWDDWVPVCEVHRAARGWLFQIVKNTFVKDYQRRRVRRDAVKNHRQDIMDGTYGEYTPSNAPYLDATAGTGKGGFNVEATAPKVFDSVFSDEVKAAVESLGSDHREVLERHYVEGQSVEAIALELDAPKCTIKTRLHRARLQLEKLLEGYASKTYGITPVVAAEAVTPKPAVLRRRGGQVEAALVGRTGKDLAEAAQNPKADPYAIDRVVTGNDNAALDVVESSTYQVAAG